MNLELQHNMLQENKKYWQKEEKDNNKWRGGKRKTRKRKK